MNIVSLAVFRLILGGDQVEGASVNYRVKLQHSSLKDWHCFENWNCYKS